MFFTYLRREIRRRKKQGIVKAIGLAIGIDLVLTVSATSAGVTTAQGKVLHSLYGVGTDITVAKTAKAGSGGPQRFRFGGAPPGERRPRTFPGMCCIAARARQRYRRQTSRQCLR
ncbi:MAG TPA: hypothetical protein VFB39_18080 [Solirubrobacteraceae bacterium]|nr:hypothetical protein [Solirubrobacteraceae bacterium]